MSMRHTLPQGIAFLALLLFAGQANAGVSPPADAIETLGAGTVNWTSGEVLATGIGAPPARAANPAQTRAMAERAAYAVALRNLLETVKGVRVDSETVVENHIVRNDTIRTHGSAGAGRSTVVSR